MGRKKIEWVDGSIFTIPLIDGSFCLGQVLDLQMKNVVRIALFDEKLADIKGLAFEKCCQMKALISLVACTREQLDYDIWKVAGRKAIMIPRHRFPNEQFKNAGWVGAKIYDASIVEEFINAFFRLLPWNDFADPFYLDKLLVSADVKPVNLIYKKA